MKPGDSAWVSWVQAPLVIDDVELMSWDAGADVVVIGAGGAGLCAALEARERGAEVIVVERFAPGGATKLSGGVYYGGGTPIQVEAGVDDSADNMFRYLRQEIRGAVSDETLRRFCDESSESLEWLMGHGVQYKGTLYPGKANYPGRGYYLYYSGNEPLKGYRERAKPAPRGHRAVHPQGLDSMTGFAYFAALEAAARQAGVQVIDHAPVQRLIVDPAGRVVGVEANVLPAQTGARMRHAALRDKFVPLDPRHIGKRRRVQQGLRDLEAAEGRPRRIRARKGVIIASGGFIQNWDMVRSVAALEHRRTVRMGAPGCDGAGIRLGQSVGGMTALMDRFDNSRSMRPEVYARGLLVNEKGERFINEMAYAGTIGEAIVQGGYSKLWAIINKPLRDEAVRGALKTGRNFYFQGLPVVLGLAAGKRARSIDGLARKLGMSPQVLGATVAAYDRAAAGAEPDAFGKDSETMQALGKGPFHAVDLSLDSMFAPMIAFTTGGLAVDEATGAVKGEDGAAVAGLYAAGRSAVGVCSITYISGMSIADCVFSGRRAGRNCAAAAGRNALG